MIPIYKVLGGRDENKAGDIGFLLNELERLAVQSGAAVAFGAHFSKGEQAQKNSIDRIGGSGVFARDPDSILTFTRHEEPDCFTVDCTLRNLPPVLPFVVRWQYPVFENEELLDPEQLRSAAGRKMEVSAEEVLDLLSEPKTTGDWLKTATAELGISGSTFYRRKRELKSRKAIHEADDKWARK